MPYTYDSFLAADPNNPAVVARNAAITIFDPADATQAPITITDPTGSPIPNPVTVNAQGFGPAFQHATLDRVGWKGAGFLGYFTSYEGMRNEAAAAKTAAQTAATNAGAAAQADLEARIASGVFKGEKGADGSNVLPTDTAIRDAINNTGSATRGALNATYAPKSLEASVARVAAIPTMAPLTRPLDAGQSAAVQVVSDSTGDDDGSVPASRRLATRFIQRLAEKYTGHHVISKKWDGANSRYFPWVEIQAQPAGRRHVITTTQGLRWVPPIHADAAFTGDEFDLRALVAPDDWTPTATQTLVTRGRKEVAGVNSNELVVGLRLKPTGSLGFMRSANGTSWATEQVSTAPVPGTDGQPLWVRGTAKVIAGTSVEIKFYTSPANDGVTWTQLGTTITLGAASAIATHIPVEGSYFEICGENWPSTAAVFKGKMYEVQVRNGIDGPCITPCNIEGWQRSPNTATTYGGAPTLYLLNAAHSGTAMADHNQEPRLSKETPNYGQQVLIINDGHNEATKAGLNDWIKPYEAWVTNLKKRLPNATVNVVGQNPHTSAWVNEAAYGLEHVKRIMELSDNAARLGWGFINVYQAYLDDPRGLGVLVGADGLHPTPTGYALTGDTVAKAAGVNV